MPGVLDVDMERVEENGRFNHFQDQNEDDLRDVLEVGQYDFGYAIYKVSA